MTSHLDVWIQHHHKVLGNFMEFCSTEKYLVLHCHPFVCVTTSGHGLWTEYDCQVSCMGSGNLYIGSFRQKNKRSAEGMARGWRLAGLPIEWGILAGSAAIHELQNWEELTDVLCGTAFFFSTKKCLQSIPQTKYLLSSFVLPFPATTPRGHSFPLSPCLFFVVVVVAEHKIYRPFETCCFQMQAPSAPSIASCPAARAEQREAHTLSPTSPPSIARWNPPESAVFLVETILHPHASHGELPAH